MRLPDVLCLHFENMHVLQKISMWLMPTACQGTCIAQPDPTGLHSTSSAGSVNPSSCDFPAPDLYTASYLACKHVCLRVPVFLMLQTCLVSLPHSIYLPSSNPLQVSKKRDPLIPPGSGQALYSSWLIPPPVRTWSWVHSLTSAKSWLPGGAIISPFLLTNSHCLTFNVNFKVQAQSISLLYLFFDCFPWTRAYMSWNNSQKRKTKPFVALIEGMMVEYWSFLPLQ